MSHTLIPGTNILIHEGNINLDTCRVGGLHGGNPQYGKPHVPVEGWKEHVPTTGLFEVERTKHYWIVLSCAFCGKWLDRIPSPGA